jgi:hypothetical protein
VVVAGTVVVVAGTVVVVAGTVVVVAATVVVVAATVVATTSSCGSGATVGCGVVTGVVVVVTSGFVVVVAGAPTGGAVVAAIDGVVAIIGNVVGGDDSSSLGANLTTNAGGNVEVVVVPMIGPVPSPDATRSVTCGVGLGARTKSTGGVIPIASSAPASVVSPTCTRATTFAGKATVRAHLRLLRAFPPEQTEKTPFWRRVAPSFSQRQSLIAATP